MLKQLKPLLFASLFLIVLIFGTLAAIKKWAGTRAPIGVAGAQSISSFEINDVASKKRITVVPGKAPFEGKTLFVNFWATWCAPCITEIPSIIKLQQLLGPAGLEVLLINIDDNPESVLPKALKKLQIPFPTYYDTDGMTANQFGVQGVPFSAIIGKDGKFLHVETGERDWAEPAVVEEVRRWL